MQLVLIVKTVNRMCNYAYYTYYFNRAFHIEEHCVPATGSIGLRGLYIYTQFSTLVLIVFIFGSVLDSTHL